MVNYRFLDSEPILVLILEHTWSTVENLVLVCFLMGTALSAPVISVGIMFSFTLAHHYKSGWLLYMLDLISV